MVIRILTRMVPMLLAALAILAVVPLCSAQSEESAIDVTSYKINAEILPDAHTLKAQTTVTYKTLKQAQSVVFEMNGSLAISSIKAPDGKTALQFIQDKVNEMNVKINLGQ